jgi:hypothetical protein
MKKVILNILFLSGLCMSAQTTVYETALSKDKPVVKYTYLPFSNKVVIKESTTLTKTVATFNKAIEFDNKLNSKIINENTKFLYLFSSLDNQYFGYSMREGLFSPHSMSFFNGKEAVNFIMKEKDFLNYGRDYFYTIFSYKPIIPFDKNYFYSVTNDKGSNALNIGKENVMLSKFEISKQKTNLIPIKKPDIERLKTKDLEVPSQIPFQSRFYSNNTFEIVTKSVKKDLTSATLYRDIYDLEGKFIRELSYNYGFSKGFIAPSNTNFSFENMFNSDLIPGTMKRNILDFNDYYIDTKTNDFYVYGILDSKESSGISLKAPLGFYIIKYSDKGDKVWEKVYDLSQTKGFKEKSQQYLRIFINLNQFCQKDALSITIKGMNSYSNYYNLFYLINKESGEVEKTANIDNNVETNKGSMSTGAKYSIFENLVYNKNKYFDSTTFLTLSLNDKVKKYIDKINIKKEVFFNSIVSQDGIWLFETDNETYYKVTLFDE